MANITPLTVALFVEEQKQDASSNAAEMKYQIVQIKEGRYRIDARSSAAKGAREGHNGHTAELPNQIAEKFLGARGGGRSLKMNSLGGCGHINLEVFGLQLLREYIHLDRNYHFEVMDIVGYRTLLLQGSMVGLHTCRFQSAS